MPTRPCLPVLCALLSTALPAQGPAGLRGRVCNRQGQPLAAAITVTKAGGSARPLRADAQGQYRVLLQDGYAEYLITFSAPGHVPVTTGLWPTLGAGLVLRDITLATITEYRQDHPDAALVLPGAEQEQAGLDAYSAGARHFNAGQFQQALPAFRMAYRLLNEAHCLAGASARPELGTRRAEAGRILGLTLVAAGPLPLAAAARAEAQALLDPALERQPDDAEVYLALHSLLAGPGEAESRRRLQARYRNRTPIVAYNLGVEALNRDAGAEALSQFQTALELDPGYADAHFQVALCLLDSGQRAQAELHLRRYLDLAPGGGFAAQARKLLP